MANSKESSVEKKLAKLNREAEEREAQKKSAKGGYRYADLIKMPVNIEALAIIPEEVAQKSKVAAIEARERRLVLAIFDPDYQETKKVIDDLKSQEYKLSIVVVSLSGLKHAWSFYRFVLRGTSEITSKIKLEKEKFLEFQKKIESLEDIKSLINGLNRESATTQLLEIVLAGALESRASDVHFEPTEEVVRLRLRVDGLLYDVVKDLKNDAYSRLITRIKLLSKLKINVSDEPQDGRFSIALPEKNIEIRTSIIPSEFGETIVLRVLDPDTIMAGLPDLGFREDDLGIIKEELKRPNGMILNTGPTGSGKTTTLYAFLLFSRSSEVKIITIEDPIEYRLEGVEQTQVDPEAGYTFETGLRSILRQDPDVLLIGEIRDLETAEIAMRSSLTGHLVFSTLHTNEAIGAIPRLIDLGVKSAVIAPALNLVIAQRLARRLCVDCRQSQEITPDLKEKIEKFIQKLPSRVDISQLKDFKIFKPKGCSKCHNGYNGRLGVFELLRVDKELEQLINQEITEANLKDFSLKKGMTTMQQDGIIKVIQGLTSFEEIERVTGVLEW